MRALTPVSSLPTLSQLVQQFTRRKVLVIGDLMADHYIYGQTERVSREAPVLIVRYEDSEVTLGGGANAAANVRALGAQVTVLGVLGDDEMGQALRARFKAAAIRVQALTAPGVQTETKTRILAGGINTTRQQMLRLDRGARGPLPSKLRQELSRAVKQLARDVDAVVVSDYGAGVVADEVRGTLRDLAADGLPVCGDSRYALKKLVGITVCKPNEPELEALTGQSVRSDAELKAAGRRALEQLQCRSLVVTRGRNGMAVFDASGSVELFASHGAAEAVDVTGAGDTVVAALSLGLASGATVLQAAQLANVAAGIVVQKPGTATVNRTELVRELKRDGR